MGRKTSWTVEQTEYLNQNVEKLSDAALASYLNKSVNCVRKHRLRLGMKKQKGRGVCKLEQKGGVDVRTYDKE